MAENGNARGARMASGPLGGRMLRPTSKVLPEHARSHNRALVLQSLYRGGTRSRADLARETGLTRVTISDLVAELIDDSLVVELGPSADVRPGKPATLLDLNREGFRIVGIDLSEHSVFRGAVLDLHGEVLDRAETPLDGATGDDALALVAELARRLVELSPMRVLGVGIGSPGIVDLAGTVLSAPNLRWSAERLSEQLATALDLPVVVANDANAAALAEHSFGAAPSDMMLVRIGHGLGSGLIVGGIPLLGSRFAAGEIGHVVVGTDRGAACACGKNGCLETWLAVPRLEAKLAAAGTADEREQTLREAGHRLGIALAPVVGALDLATIVLSGPSELLDGPLLDEAARTIRSRTMAELHAELELRMTDLGQDIVMRGAAAMVLSGQLGVL